MNTYYEIQATNTEDSEDLHHVLFGSFDKTDCTYELDAEKEGWKSEGYESIKITSREIEEEPDAGVYGEDFKAIQTAADAIKAKADYQGWDDTDRFVECHSAAFLIIHGREADWNEEEELCEEVEESDTYAKIRAIVN